MNKYFWVTVVVIWGIIKNFRIIYQQTKSLFCKQPATKHISKIFSYLFGIKNEMASTIGIIYFYVAFLPTFVLSLVIMALMIKSLLIHINANDFSINDYLPHIVATVVILLSRVSYSVVNNILEKQSDYRNRKIRELMKFKLNFFKNISIRTWVFAVLCFAPILFFKFNILPTVICFISATLCVMAEIKFLESSRITVVVFIQLGIIVVGGFLAFLFSLPLDA